LPAVDDENVLVGTGTADDGAAYRISDEVALIQSVDFFTPVVDDPYWFGAIAAANSISDIYAMGGSPAIALNIVGFPKNHPDLPLEVLGDILRGGADKAREAGVSVLGGHSIDDREPKYGMAVTGFCHPDRIWTNVGAKPGDQLVLTKPLGTGIIASALRKQACEPAVLQGALESMATLNRAAAEAATGLDVHACTDITGFGLLGHLGEMLGRGGLKATLSVSAIPVLDGARELAQAGYVPGGTRRNLNAESQRTSFGAEVGELDQLLVCDAQTSGGLVLALTPADAAALQSKLGRERAAIIGEVSASDSPKIVVTG